MAYTIPQGPFAAAPTVATQAQNHAVPSQDPLAYATPQSAIAAGLDPAVVRASWAAGLAQYATQQDALAAGISPAIISEYWPASRAAIAATPQKKPSLWIPALIAVAAAALFSAKGE